MGRKKGSHREPRCSAFNWRSWLELQLWWKHCERRWCYMRGNFRLWTILADFIQAEGVIERAKLGWMSAKTMTADFSPFWTRFSFCKSETITQFSWDGAATANQDVRFSFNPHSTQISRYLWKTKQTVCSGMTGTQLYGREVSFKWVGGVQTDSVFVKRWTLELPKGWWGYDWCLWRLASMMTLVVKMITTVMMMMTEFRNGECLCWTGCNDDKKVEKKWFERQSQSSESQSAPNKEEGNHEIAKMCRNGEGFNVVGETSQELRMLSPVTLYSRVKM